MAWVQIHSLVSVSVVRIVLEMRSGMMKSQSWSLWGHRVNVHALYDYAGLEEELTFQVGKWQAKLPSLALSCPQSLCEHFDE